MAVRVAFSVEEGNVSGMGMRPTQRTLLDFSARLVSLRRNKRTSFCVKWCSGMVFELAKIMAGIGEVNLFRIKIIPWLLLVK